MTAPFRSKELFRFVLSDDLLQQGDVFREGFPSGGGERTGRERAVVLKGFGHGHQAFLLQRADVGGEVAVRQAQGVTQFGERQLRRRGEHGHDGEPPFLVDDTIKLKKRCGVHGAGFGFSVK